jgi:hypothetical protein
VKEETEIRQIAERKGSIGVNAGTTNLGVVGLCRVKLVPNRVRLFDSCSIAI